VELYRIRGGVTSVRGGVTISISSHPETDFGIIKQKPLKQAIHHAVNYL